MSVYGSQENLVPPAAHEGLGIVTACLFIVGEIAGTGILALPDAIKSCGWSGAGAIIVVCLAYGYAGVLLGECWNLLEAQDESLKNTKTRNAYSLIGQRAAGKFGEYITTVSLTVQMFGVGVVLLLLLSEIIGRLMQQIGLYLTFCEWAIVLGLVLLPLTFAGSPVDFWPVAVSAMSSTAIASVLLIIEITRQNLNKQNSIPSDETPTTTTAATTVASIMETVATTMAGTTEMPTTGEPEIPPFTVDVKTYLLGLSTMAFGFSGASAMPTIQNDMKDKTKFRYATIAAFILLLFIYLPVAIVGYHFYGNNLKENVVRNLDPSFLTTTIDVLMAIHIFSAFLIIINPVNLFLEHWVEVKHSFNYKRSFSRTVVALFAILVGLSVPKFGKLLNLVGASLVGLQSVILPSIFYYKLRNQQFEERPTEVKPLPLAIKVVIWVLVVVFSAVAAAGTWFSLVEIFGPSAFTEPCFVSNCDKY